MGNEKKKVLILSASPRKGGNSDTLCDAFLKGAAESGHMVKKVFLRDHQIHYCTGCGVCNTTHQCVQADDMAEILNHMVDADVLVLATPVYFYTMDGQLKTLIDRTVPRYQELADKEFYFILTAADADKASLERSVSGLRGFTEDCLPRTREKGILYGTGVWQMGEVQGRLVLSQAYEMGRRV